MKPDEKPLRDLIGKDFEVLGFEEKIYDTNLYTLINIRINGKDEKYYTTSNVIRRQIALANKKECIPFKTKLTTGEGHKGKWFAFRSEIFDKE